MSRKHLKIVPLEERIVLDAAVAAVVASAVSNACDHPPTTPVIYVDGHATGSVHDGTSWAKAYTNLQDALNKAASTPGGDQIWIAQGTYVPTKVYSPNGVTGGALGINDSHLKTFNLPDGVSLYGGFKAGMMSLSQRNPDKYVTILSGDLSGNDITNTSDPGYTASRADNVWHVVTMANDISYTGGTARLDGLSIVEGNAVGPEQSPFFTPVLGNNYDYGGGMYINFDSHVTINHVTFSGNFAASDGGGLWSNNSDLLVNDSTFLNNSAIARAGALEGWSTFGGPDHTMTINHTLFKNNSAVVFGGAVVGEGTLSGHGSKMYINDSTFVGNTADEGAGITVDSLDVIVNNSIFLNNTAHVNGGAIATTNVVNTFVGGPYDFVTEVHDSTFIGNVAEGDLTAHAFMNSLFSNPGATINFALGGGALTNYMHGNLTVDGSLFLNNTAINSDGGAILSGSGSAVVPGGGPIIAAGVNTTITNSLFLNNTAQGGNGGAIAAETEVGYIAPPSPEASVITVKNNILSGNRATNGGAIAIISATATIKNNLFFWNNDASGHGDDVYGIGSKVNGVLTSSAGAKNALKLANSWLLLDMDDIYLA